MTLVTLHLWPFHRENAGLFGCSDVNFFWQNSTATSYHPTLSAHSNGCWSKAVTVDNTARNRNRGVDPEAIFLYRIFFLSWPEQGKGLADLELAPVELSQLCRIASIKERERERARALHEWLRIDMQLTLYFCPLPLCINIVWNGGRDKSQRSKLPSSTWSQWLNVNRFCRQAWRLQGSQP